MQFKTHTGEIVSGERLTKALNAIADFYTENAYAIYRENAYASHVTEFTKMQAKQQQLDMAERIRCNEEPWSFCLWQRVNTELTGECVPFLP